MMCEAGIFFGRFRFHFFLISVVDIYKSRRLSVWACMEC